ncbi:MAG TPA: hypothetical protein DCP02_01475 [Actinobacteria bacterium]|nr:hypothetical protein [Actinomycetota bacterium]
MNRVLVNEIDYDCPVCNKKHKVGIYQEKNTVIIKKQPVKYLEIYYYCLNSKEGFYPSDIMDKNLLIARDNYKKINNLLTSSKIKKIRKSYGLNQKEFSNILGWGDITVQRYENKAVQDITYDEVMRRAKIDRSFLFEGLKKNKDRFSDQRFNEISTLLKGLIKRDQASYLKKEAIKAMYIEYGEPSDYNGMKILDLNIVEQVLRFFTQFSSDLYKTKLLKLLWYADFYNYKNYGVSVSGLVYMHRQFGAIPLGYNTILDAFDDSISVREEFLGYKNGNQEKIAYRIENIKKVEMDKLKPSEIASLEIVNKYFKNMGSKAISDHMHEEDAYKNTLDGNFITYKWAEKLKI